MKISQRPGAYPNHSYTVKVLEVSEQDRAVLRKAIKLLVNARRLIDRPGSDLDFEFATAEKSCQHLVDVAVFGYIELD